MSGSSDVSVPLVRSLPTSSDSDPSSRRSQTTSLALLLGRVAGRRGPSVAVRETAARELEERRNDWGYSKPVVAMDISWNMMFVLVALVWLFSTWEEKPKVPIRLWICGYAVQCLIHVLLVWMEYRRRRRRRTGRRENGRSRSGRVDLEAGEDRTGLELVEHDEDDEGLFMVGGSTQSR